MSSFALEKCGEHIKHFDFILPCKMKELWVFGHTNGQTIGNEKSVIPNSCLFVHLSSPYYPKGEQGPPEAATLRVTIKCRKRHQNL